MSKFVAGEQQIISHDGCVFEINLWGVWWHKTELNPIPVNLSPAPFTLRFQSLIKCLWSLLLSHSFLHCMLLLTWPQFNSRLVTACKWSVYIRTKMDWSTITNSAILKIIEICVPFTQACVPQRCKWLLSHGGLERVDNGCMIPDVGCGRNSWGWTLFAALNQLFSVQIPPTNQQDSATDGQS